MMATFWLPLFQLLTLLATPLFGYAVYGTKRYARSATYPNSPAWVPVQTMVRSQRYPLNYYEVYPYNPEDYYYGQDNYPLYYPRTSKYEVYQAVLPYYYQDRYLNPSYYDYSGDGSNLLKEQMLHDAEIEEREERQPIGHEKLYENQNDDASLSEGDDEENIDDVNAAFLQNLIMSHMYKDALDNNNNKYNNYNRYPYYDYASGDDYGKWDDQNAPAAARNVYEQEDQDDDVRALKQLAKPTPRNNNEDIHWFKENNFRKQKEQNKKKYDEYLKSKRSGLNVGEMLVEATRSSKFADGKIESATTAATPAVSDRTQGDANKKGQKEEVLMRPATPVRHIFSNPVLEMMTKNDNDRKRSPSVYDKIRHMLDVEKSLETKYGDESAIRPSMKKRLFTSDDKLTQQLTVLKKSQ